MKDCRHKRVRQKCELCGKTCAGSAMSAHMKTHGISTKKTKQKEYKEPKLIAELGVKRQPEQLKDRWELPDIEAKFPMFCFADYFKTSGNAIAKVEYGIKNVQEILKNLQNFRKSLLKAKGSGDYLEQNGKIVIRKYKRVRKLDGPEPYEN